MSRSRGGGGKRSVPAFRGVRGSLSAPPPSFAPLVTLTGRRLYLQFSQGSMLNKLRGTSSMKERKERPFLHLKFGDGKPPEFGHHHHFAHQLSLIPSHDLVLPEGLATDVQREGIGRYLTNNFKEGSPVHEVVHEREKDESTFILVTQNWHRSSGDQKLHLSLYVYQEDRHCATWHAFTDRTISLHAPARSKSASTTPYTTPSDLQSAHPPPAPKPSRANEEVLRARLDRPSAAPPKLDNADPTASTTRTRNLRLQEHDSDSSEEVEEPKRPARVAKPAARDDSDDEELGDSPIPAPRSRSSLPPRPNPNPHSRAPTPSVVTSAPPAPSRSARSGKDDPPPSRADNWDAPPPEEDLPTSPDSWIQPPADEPNEGFEELFGRDKSSKRTTRKPRPRSSSPPPEATSKPLPKKAQHQRDESPSPERPRPSRASRRESSDVDDVEPTSRGRSDDPPARSSRRAPSKARSYVKEGVEAIKRKEKELEERERRLKEMELEERERKLKEREVEIQAKENARFKAKERDLDRDEEQAFVRERRKERRERSRSPSPGGSPPPPPPPPRSARRKSISASLRPLSPPTAALDDERPAEIARKRSESRVRDVVDSKAADLTSTSRRTPRPHPSAPPAEDEGFEVSSLKPTRSRIEDEPAPLGAVAALGGWVRGVTARLKGQAAPVEQDPAEEDDEELEEERRCRRAARKERRKRRERELAEAEDAVASAADAERRSKAKKPVEASYGDLEGVEDEDRRPRSAGRTRSDSPADVETDADERRSRRSHPSRSKPIVDDTYDVEKPLHDSRPIKPAEVEPESGRSTRRTRPPKPTSDSDQEPPKSASIQRDRSTNPPTRQRAMSLSASVDAGLRGLRESVAKAVENIARPKEEAEAERIDRRSSRTSRRNAPREEARHQDDDSDAGDRRPARKSRALEADGHETDVSSQSSRRVKPGTTELLELEEKAPPSRSRSSRKPKSVATDGEESDALPSTRKLRSEPRPDQLFSESDAPPSSSRKDPSSRKKRRETSDEELEETEMDKIAKANTNVNSSTITPEEIAKGSRAREMPPSSPSSRHPLSVREELRRVSSRAKQRRPLPTSTSSGPRFEEERVDGRVLGESSRKFASPPPSPRAEHTDGEAISSRFNVLPTHHPTPPPSASPPLVRPIPQRHRPSAPSHVSPAEREDVYEGRPSSGFPASSFHSGSRQSNAPFSSAASFPSYSTSSSSPGSRSNAPAPPLEQPRAPSSTSTHRGAQGVQPWTAARDSTSSFGGSRYESPSEDEGLHSDEKDDINLHAQRLSGPSRPLPPNHPPSRFSTASSFGHDPPSRFSTASSIEPEYDARFQRDPTSRWSSTTRDESSGSEDQSSGSDSAGGAFQRRHQPHYPDSDAEIEVPTHQSFSPPAQTSYATDTEFETDAEVNRNPRSARPTSHAPFAASSRSYRGEGIIGLNASRAETDPSDTSDEEPVVRSQPSRRREPSFSRTGSTFPFSDIEEDGYLRRCRQESSLGSRTSGSEEGDEFSARTGAGSMGGRGGPHRH